MSKKSKRNRPRAGKARAPRRKAGDPVPFEAALQHYGAGRLKEAEFGCRRILAAAPADLNANHLLGVIYAQSGQHLRAVPLLRAALRVKPHFAELHNNLGCTYQALNRLVEAQASYRAAIRIKPDYVAVHNNLGSTYQAMNRAKDALASYRRAIEIKPDHAEAHNNLGVALKASGRLEEAEASYRRAIELRPAYAEAYNNLAGVLIDVGRLEEAESCYRKAIQIKPDYASVYRQLSVICKLVRGSEEVTTMEVLYERDDITDKDRVDLAFGLARCYENSELFDEAFELIQVGNRLKRKTYTYSCAAESAYFRRIREVFNRDFMAGHVTSGIDAEDPIFILGMPRSGTSLVEQVLASHPAVHGAGEVPYLSELLESFPEGMTRLGGGQLRQIGRSYLARLRARADGARFITNKMPGNFCFIGVIGIVLPKARIIHCTRNPMDTGLSIFKNYFQVGHPYAYDLEELGHYLRLYEDLMAYWHDLLPGRIRDVAYEDLVADPEPRIRELLAYCDLPFDAACVHFYDTERSARTLSVAQVRQPMSKDSVGAWRRYEKELQPLRGKGVGL